MTTTGEYCRFCGRAVPSDADYCGQCGRSVRGADANAARTPVDRHRSRRRIVAATLVMVAVIGISAIGVVMILPRLGLDGCEPPPDGLGCTETLRRQIEEGLDVTLTQQTYAAGDDAVIWETDMPTGGPHATLVTVVGDEGAADRIVLNAAGDVSSELVLFEAIVESVAPGAGVWARDVVEESTLAVGPPEGHVTETRVFGEVTAIVIVFPNIDDSPPRRAIIYVVADDDGCDQPEYLGALTFDPCPDS